MNGYVKASVVVLVFASGWWVGAGRVQGEWDANKANTAQSQLDAIDERVTQNQKLIDTYAAANAAITRAKNEEITAVRTSLAVSLRRGTGISARPASTTETNPTGSIDATSAASGVFREDIDRDIRAAMMEMEEVSATARACQAFVRSNLSQ